MSTARKSDSRAQISCEQAPFPVHLNVAAVLDIVVVVVSTFSPSSTSSSSRPFSSSSPKPSRLPSLVTRPRLNPPPAHEATNTTFDWEDGIRTRGAYRMNLTTRTTRSPRSVLTLPDSTTSVRVRHMHGRNARGFCRSPYPCGHAFCRDVCADTFLRASRSTDFPYYALLALQVRVRIKASPAVVIFPLLHSEFHGCLEVSQGLALISDLPTSSSTFGQRCRWSRSPYFCTADSTPVTFVCRAY